MDKFTGMTCVRTAQLCYKDKANDSYKIGRYLYRFTSHFKDDDMFIKVLESLKSKPGPTCVTYSEIIPHDKVALTWNFTCFILIWSDNEQNWRSRGLGYYFGSGFIVTAYHVLENIDNCSIFVIFPTFGHHLIYLAHCEETNQNQDLAKIKLQGCIDPLQYINVKNVKSQIDENENIYFFSLCPSGNYQKKKGKIMKRHPGISNMLENEYLISVAGNEGDSGSPVFSKYGELVGLFRAVSKSTNGLTEYGHILKIDKSFLNL